MHKPGGGPWQGTLAEYEITDGHRVSPPGNPTKGNYLEEDGRDSGDELDNYSKVTNWQRIAYDRHMWKQHAEAFAQPRDTIIVIMKVVVITPSQTCSIERIYFNISGKH